jgi:hypothetical protein
MLFHSVAVADYSYDSAGELISEWDPRLATPLVTSYSYDENAADANYGRILQISPSQAAGSDALAPWTLSYDTTSGDVNYGKVLTISRSHAAAYGGGTATSTIDYSVPLTTAAGGPVDMDAATVATWGQTDVPASAVAVFPASHVPSATPTATDYEYAEIDYYDANGREVNTASYVNGAWAVSTTQYDAYGNQVSSLTAADWATAMASSNPAATASELSTVNIYGCDNFGTVGTCTSADQQYQVLTDSYGPAHNADVNGTVETIRTHTAYSYDANAPDSDVDPSGNPYMLVTSQTESASLGDTIPGSGTADARTTAYRYSNSSTDIGWTLGNALTRQARPVTVSMPIRASRWLIVAGKTGRPGWKPGNSHGPGSPAGTWVRARRCRASWYRWLANGSGICAGVAPRLSVVWPPLVVRSSVVRRAILPGRCPNSKTSSPATRSPGS